jgi:hypothetical protein
MKNKTLVTLGMIGGLVVLGGLAYAYFRKPKLNSEGFYNATGTGKMTSRCNYCRNSQGNIYSADSTGKCKGGDFCVANSI